VVNGLAKAGIELGENGSVILRRGCRLCRVDATGAGGVCQPLRCRPCVVALVASTQVYMIVYTTT
jgi:hypothetical protein